MFWFLGVPSDACINLKWASIYISLLSFQKIYLTAFAAHKPRAFLFRVFLTYPFPGHFSDNEYRWMGSMEKTWATVSLMPLPLVPDQLLFIVLSPLTSTGESAGKTKRKWNCLVCLCMMKGFSRYLQGCNIILVRLLCTVWWRINEVFELWNSGRNCKRIRMPRLFSEAGATVLHPSDFLKWMILDRKKNDLWCIYQLDSA